MRRAFVMLLWMALTLCSFEQAFGQQTSGTIRSVDYTAAQGEERIDIRLEGPRQHEIFLIDGEKPRLVLDFPDYRYAGGSPVAVAGGVLVQSIRVGIHHKPERKIRLVVDLTPGRGISWRQEFSSEGDLLTLIIVPATEEVGQPPEAPEAGKPPEGSASPSVPEPAPDQTRQPEPEAAPAQITAEPSKIKVAPKPEVKQQEEPRKPEEDSKAREAPTVAAQPPEQPEQPESPEQTQQLPGQPEQLEQPELPQKPEPPEPPEPPQQTEQATASPAEGPPEAKEDAAPALLSVTFDNAFSHSGEMVLLQLSDFHPPEISTREKAPPGIFCDFAGAVIAEEVPREIKAGGRYVDKVLVVAKDDGVRVILELVPGSDYDLQQVFFKEDNLFVLIVNLLEN